MVVVGAPTPIKPAPKASPKVPVDEQKQLAFVNKGGSVAAGKETPKAANHPLRFPDGDLFARLERARKGDAVRLPRNTWILQAIAEKLEREGA